MKLMIAFLALSFLASCASKTTTPAPTTASTTETAPAPAQATPPPPAQMEKSRRSAKKAAATPSAEKSEVGSASVACKAGSDERKLEIVVKDAGCELQYTKTADTKTIASQINGSEKCEEVMTSVKDKLVAANFACQ